MEIIQKYADMTWTRPLERHLNNSSGRDDYQTMFYLGGPDEPSFDYAETKYHEGNL